MTRKVVSEAVPQQPELTIRPRGITVQNGANEASTGQLRSSTYVNSANAFMPRLADESSTSIYHFGAGYGHPMYQESVFAMPTAMSMPANTQEAYHMEEEDNLLSTFMMGEIAETGDLFEDAYYWVQEDFFTQGNPGTNRTQGGFTFPFHWPPQHPVQSGNQAQAPITFAETLQTTSIAHQPANSLGISILPTSYAQLPPKSHRELRPKGPAQPHPAPPDSSHADEAVGIRGRKRPLSPDGRASAQRVRSVRACGRCHALKAKCEPERPCKPCKSRHKRSLDFPCMPELPQDRWTHIFTEELYGHLDLKGGTVMEKMPRPFRDESNKPFILRLHQYFDDPELTIPVVRFVPTSREDIVKSVFPIVPNGKDLEVQPTEIWSPPLVPAINDQNFAEWTKKFRWSVRRWLDCAEIYDDIEWHSTFFRVEHGKPWARSIFAHVCQYFHQVEWRGCDSLKSSLQSTVFAYLLGHSFYVPHEEIQSVLERSGMSSDEYNGEFRFVSPIHVDRFIKAMLYPFFRVSVARSLKGLQGLCAPNRLSKYARDQIMATSIVLLIVAGSQQSKAVEKAVALDRRGQPVDWTNVHKQIKEIEEWVIDLILQLWDYKFSEDVKWTPAEPQDRSPAFRAKIFGLYEKFENSYNEYRGTLDQLPCELPAQINQRTFGAINIDRVLLRFYRTCFPSPTAKASDSSSGQTESKLKEEHAHDAFVYSLAPEE